MGGPSGSGKSTLIKRLLDLDGCRLAVSATTRPPRPGEVDGRDYRFVPPEDFSRMVREGSFVEWAEVHGNRYGTPASELESRGDGDAVVLLDLDVQGLRRLRALGVPDLSVFIAPPDMDALAERLRRRGTESEARIQERLVNAAREMEADAEYDNVLVNTDLDATFNRLVELLGLDGEEGSKGRRPSSVNRRS